MDPVNIVYANNTHQLIVLLRDHGKLNIRFASGYRFKKFELRRFGIWEKPLIHEFRDIFVIEPRVPCRNVGSTEVPQ